jgi:hypothetical protein
MKIIRLLVVESSLSALLFSQSATLATSSAAVHISGSISACGKTVPGVFVRFVGKEPHIVKANDAGFYEADLPLGIWTATTPPDANDATDQTLSRPRHFGLNAPGSLLLDIQLRPPMFCDIGATPEVRAAFCWGEKFFPAPSSDGAPLEVDLFGLVPCSINHPSKEHREFATFDLLSVHADNVVYHPSERILESERQRSN